jgi:type I restriction enzyme S subunit
MNADRLLALFEPISEAPDAIPRLRRFILELAVRGKLVEQDPEDEPAEELFCKYLERRIDLVSQGKIRRPKPSKPISDEETPIDLPCGWIWARLNEIGHLSGGMTPSMGRPDYWDGAIPWLSPKDIKYDEITESELRLSEIGLSASRLELYPPGCLFIVARSGILKRTLPVSINKVPAAANQDMKVLAPFVEGQERFLQIMLRALTGFILRNLVKTGTTVQSLKYGEFAEQPFPIPPLAEQHRIVTKVDELMALCDQLEAARQQREQCRERLVASSLQRLNQVGDDLDTFRDDARFALQVLPRITTTAAHIKQLRQTILNLAVRGKLTEQTAEDEPAANRLIQIRQALSSTIASMGLRLRRSSSSPTETPEEDLAAVPSSWALSNLGSIAIVLDPNPSHRYPSYDGGTVPILSTQEFKGLDEWDPSTAKLVPHSFFEYQSTSCRFEHGDIVFARKGRLGLPRFLPKLKEFTFSHTVFLLKPMAGVAPDYLLWLLRREEAIAWLTNEMNTNTGVPTLGKEKMERLPVPLPPLAEQHLIVAKVNQLMALCDQLEQQLGQAEQAGRGLLGLGLMEAIRESSQIK